MPKKAAESSKVQANKADDIFKNPDLKNALSQIEKRFGEGAIMPLGLDRTPSLSGMIARARHV